MPVIRQAQPRARTPRRGMTLVELLVGMVLASIVGAAVIKVLSSQQRFYARAVQTLDGRSQVRQALSLLPTELSTVTPGENELVTVLDTAVEFRTTIGAGVACTVVPSGGGRAIDIAPIRNDSLALSGFTFPPQIGDTLMLMNDSTGNFMHVAVTAVDSSALYCAAGPFSAAPAGSVRYQVKIAEALNALAYTAGVPLRVTRKVRYSLYKSPSDSLWYLGRRVQTAGSTALSGIQMVSGPYAPPATNGSGGLMLRYYDSAGAVVPVASPELTARIDIAVRGDSARMSNATKTSEVDSLTISLRNRY